VKTRQPDPCPRNYYRNDAGACLFALAPNAKERAIPKPVDTEPNSKQGKKPLRPQVKGKENKGN